MNDVNEFLAYAIRLEEDAARRFGELADAMETHGKADVAGLFRQLSDFSRLHLEEARNRAGFHDVPEMAAGDFQWPGGPGDSPESASIQGADPFTDVAMALDVALESEKAGMAFYAHIERVTEDPEVRALAAEFAEEEREHVQTLERWIARQEAAPAAE